jgi:hypothetical protein
VGVESNEAMCHNAPVPCIVRRYIPFVVAGLVLGVFLSYTEDQPSWVRYAGYLVIYIAVVAAMNLLLKRIFKPTDRDIALRGR